MPGICGESPSSISDYLVFLKKRRSPQSLFRKSVAMDK